MKASCSMTIWAQTHFPSQGSRHLHCQLYINYENAQLFFRRTAAWLTICCSLFVAACSLLFLFFLQNRSQVAGQATAKLKTPDSSSMAVRDREVASADSSQQPNLTFDAKVQVALQPDLKTEDAPVAFDFRKAHAQLDMTLNKHLEEMKAKLLVLEVGATQPQQSNKETPSRMVPFSFSTQTPHSWMS